MVNTKKTTVIICLTLMCAVLMAGQWTVKEQVGTDGVLERQDGRTVAYQSDAALSESDIARLTACLDTVWAMPGLSGTTATAAFDDNDSFRFIVKVDSLSYNGTELAQYLPSGLAFRFDTALFYDVTVKVGELIPKVEGAYVAPDSLAEHIMKAVAAPDLFLYDSYVIDRLERLEAAVMALSKKGIFSRAALVDQETVAVIRSLYNENPSLTQKEMLSELKARGIAASSADVSAVYMVYLGQIE